MNDSNISDLISLPELARLRKVSRQTVYNWLKANKAPKHERIGGRYFFYRSHAINSSDRTS